MSIDELMTALADANAKYIGKANWWCRLDGERIQLLRESVPYLASIYPEDIINFLEEL